MNKNIYDGSNVIRISPSNRITSKSPPSNCNLNTVMGKKKSKTWKTHLDLLGDDLKDPRKQARPYQLKFCLLEHLIQKSLQLYKNSYSFFKLKFVVAQTNHFLQIVTQSIHIFSSVVW